ncbi:uncharacterized protein E5676_scaffold1369G00110 [Cucumis melo var. makuwa]|uniref:Reverse transcriptase n=1 Tax=Cucumis melo var. makuwa TaxID=1194695 RepID=A0A5A7SV15_CUCMM|nr:uncharacterized protein E6C27_scaffold57G001510 [Cucumis melo var. makuwa]TYK03597.1 uncharacterized protein E5676_scaffold1369G00110 [Cucumis melo var. makuwa]
MLSALRDNDAVVSAGCQGHTCPRYYLPMAYVVGGSIEQGPERSTSRARRADALPSRSSDSIRYLESRLEEIFEKAGTMDAVAGRVEGLPIQELLARVDTLEANTNVKRTVNYERGDSSSGFAAHMEERVNVNTRLSLTMRAMTNQVPEPKPFCGVRDTKALENFIFDLEQYLKATNTVTEEAKVTLRTMYLCEDAKLWWRSRYMDIQEGCCTIDTWDVLKKELRSDSQDVRRHQSSLPGRIRNSRLSSSIAVGRDECSGKDRRSHQSNTENTWRRPNNRSPPKRPLNSDDKSNKAEDQMGQIDESEKTRIGAIKYMSSLQKKSGERHVPTKGGLLYVDTWINQKQTKSTMVDSGATHNFITEAEARRLRLYWEKDSGRIKAVNSVALPIIGLVKRTTIKLGGWKGPVDFVVVKMDDFDVVLGMEFLFEHQVIPMPSAKCLAITGYFPTVVQADIRQPNGFKMISTMQLDKSPAQEEPPSAAILLGALEKPGETVPKDTMCVPEKCHEVLPNSWPKSVSIRRTIDHGIELLLKAKASAKNAYRMALPELAKLRKPSKTLLNTGFRRPVQASYGVHVLPQKKKDRSPQQCIDRRIQSKLTVRRKYPLPMLTRRVDRPCGVKYLPKSDIGPRYCRVRTTKAKGLEKNCVTGHEAYKFPVVSLSLTDAKGGKCCSVQSQINVLGHVGECHQSGLLTEEDTHWSGNLECQAAFNGLKQAMIEGPSLKVVDATKTPKVEAEQFSCVLGEYLHHCIDGRQKNWVQLLKVAQFGHGAQIDSLRKRSPFEIKGKRHSVLPSLADDLYVGDRPQVHRVGEEWEQMADIAQVCLEEASRPMEERVDQKRCPLEFEWMTKLPINDATTPYDYLSTWTWRKTEKSRKSLLTE